MSDLLIQKTATPVPPDALAWLDRVIEKYRLAPEGAHARAIREALGGQASAPLPASGDVGRAPQRPTRDEILAVLHRQRKSAESAEMCARWMSELFSAALTASPDAERIAELEARVAELEALINSPETESWIRGVELEAAHQIERWGAEHDVGKTPFDWFWLIGYLAQKGAASAVAGDIGKAKHHTISTGAALLNWHRNLSGANTEMRPGIDPVERGVS